MSDNMMQEEIERIFGAEVAKSFTFNELEVAQAIAFYEAYSSQKSFKKLIHRFIDEVLPKTPQSRTDIRSDVWK